ncbi:hypothetical protein IJJ12_03525 [bacterium]|nr:hypothetical protein [bacterium]
MPEQTTPITVTKPTVGAAVGLNPGVTPGLGQNLPNNMPTVNPGVAPGLGQSTPGSVAANPGVTPGLGQNASVNTPAANPGVAPGLTGKAPALNVQTQNALAAGLVTPAGATAPAPVPAAKAPAVVDSFGQTVTPADMQIDNNATMPQFVNGVLTPSRPVTPAPAAASVSAAGPEALVTAAGDKPAGTTATETKEAKTAKTPLGVTIIIYVIVFILVALGVFGLWYYMDGLNQQLQAQIRSEKTATDRVTAQLTACLDENRANASSQQAVYFDKDGNFSFYQKIPNLITSSGEDEKTVTMTYGDVVGDKAVEGFTAQLSYHNGTGKGLLDVVNTEYERRDAIIQRYGLRVEALADNEGYSFVANDDETETLVYYLQKSASNTAPYIRFEYTIVTSSEVKYSNYEKVINQILSSITIY